VSDFLRAFSRLRRQKGFCFLSAGLTMHRGAGLRGVDRR
jgi:hypothetical protein